MGIRKKFLTLSFISLSGLFLLFPANSSHGYHSVKDTLTIQTVWVTGNQSCYHNDNARMQEWYNEIIRKYLSMYGLTFYPYKPVCLTQLEYNNYEPPDYTDLLIVIYNKNVGRDELHSRNIGGFFSWENSETKNELRIEVCECPSYNFNEDVWVVSHELAHFALFYLGYQREVFEGWVHAVQSKYYTYCPDGDTTDIQCNGLWQKIEGYSRDYKVMRVYPETFDVTPPQTKFVNTSQEEISRTISNKDTDKDGISDSRDFCILQKETFNDYQDWDGCPDTKPFPYKEKSLELQRDINWKITTLKKGVYTAEESLYSTWYENSNAQKEVEKAWTALWWAKKHLGDAEWTQKEGHTLISKSNFEDAYYKYKYSWTSAEKIEPYLFEITKRLNTAHRLQYGN